MIELQMKDVDPSELRPGNVLMDDDGVPFAVVRSAPEKVLGDVSVATSCYPQGGFDVRTFTGAPECRPTRGLAGIESYSSYALAVARAERLNRERTGDALTVWREHSGVYWRDSAYRATSSRLDVFMPVRFGSGMKATIAWMGEK